MVSLFDKVKPQSTSSTANFASGVTLAFKYKLPHVVFILYLQLGPVHTSPEELENAALFLQLGLPSTLNYPSRLETQLIEDAL